MLLFLIFSLDISLFPEDIISLIHFRLTFVVEIGTMKHDVKFARYIQREAFKKRSLSLGGRYGNRTLYIMEYRHPPKTGLRCVMRPVFVMDSNAIILFFFSIRNWDSPRWVVSLLWITRLLVNARSRYANLHPRYC